MTELKKIQGYIDQRLDVANIRDIAINGLQISNNGSIKKIVTAVDAGEYTAKLAIEKSADLLLVHHGLYWGRAFTITGRYYKTLKTFLDNNLALIAEHLPLDFHREIGNNALIADALGLKQEEWIAEFKGQAAVMTASFPEPQSAQAVFTKVNETIGEPINMYKHGPENIRRMAVCSGGGNFAIEEAALAGCDAFLTGDAKHVDFHLSKEMGIHVIHAGHYQTEVFGVRKLGEELAEQFDLEHEFIDYPSGL